MSGVTASSFGVDKLSLSLPVPPTCSVLSARRAAAVDVEWEWRLWRTRAAPLGRRVELEPRLLREGVWRVVARRPGCALVLYRAWTGITGRTGALSWGGDEERDRELVCSSPVRTPRGVARGVGVAFSAHCEHPRERVREASEPVITVRQPSQPNAPLSQTPVLSCSLTSPHRSNKSCLFASLHLPVGLHPRANNSVFTCLVLSGRPCCPCVSRARGTSLFFCWWLARGLLHGPNPRSRPMPRLRIPLPEE
ncbi:hypothetical protein K402DRAFT_109586 [Aulographum hederae CBS 113979]|uniref:Uncharacterized protein n=1 Tax=Aulographum hederae CBS 113979 TaxID=1176131 RepID=A0A6G1GXK2_9PEZI|nr:hypothetical protein K402DRAFT_109586 [Aulographum hederae CBS 113979]